MAKERADLTDAERAEVDRRAEQGYRAREVLSGIDWALHSGAAETLEGVIAWLEGIEAENNARLDELFGRAKGGAQ